MPAETVTPLARRITAPVKPAIGDLYEVAEPFVWEVLDPSHWTPFATRWQTITGHWRLISIDPRSGWYQLQAEDGTALHAHEGRYISVWDLEKFRRA